MKRNFRLLAAIAAVALCALVSTAFAANLVEFVPGTAVLLNQSGGGGGNGGNGTVVSSSTSIFTPATEVDYKRFGGEPSVAVDRYAFTTATACMPKPAPCYRDLVYQSAPQGVVSPRYSQFWKSDDLGQSFRKSQQFPIHGLEQTNAGGGGGDSHQAVGELTHDVYFVDLTLAPGITMNVSEDLGETWRSDAFGEGLNFLDDRQWVEADEAVDRVYVSTINLLDPQIATLVSIENHTGWPFTGQLTEECNPATFTSGLATPAAPVPGPTFCPDPADQFLWVAGPVVADNEGTATRPPSHNVYIPFIRRIASDPLGTGIFGIDEWQLWVAKSTDQGHLWTRHHVATRPAGNNPANIFPQLTIDRGGNLYYDWSETQGGPAESTQVTRRDRETKQSVREQDIFYAWSTTAGTTWSQPINLTKETGDTAIFPWMVAGDTGQVDVVYYKANNGLNSNIALFDSTTGQECDDPSPTCQPNGAVWNVFFGQSQNALNTGPNFKSVQVSAEPNHIGQICTAGLNCDGDRDLLDFFTVDVDHLGAAHIAFSDDNRRRSSDTQDYMTRQIGGNSVFKNTTIGLTSSWPIRDHSVTDRMGDVTNTASAPIASCASMDVLKTSVSRSGDTITANVTLNGTPTSAKAAACGNSPPNPGPVSATGGLWGVEFWAASDPAAAPPANTGPANRFYIAYHDNPLFDGAARVEGGTMDRVNLLVTSLEFNQRTTGTLGGNCFPATTATCTISMTVSGSSLGITPGNALNNITGLSAYLFGSFAPPIPATRVILGNSEQADAAAPFDYSGSGTP